MLRGEKVDLRPPPFFCDPFFKIAVFGKNQHHKLHKVWLLCIGFGFAVHRIRGSVRKRLFRAIKKWISRNFKMDLKFT